jgi:hypothetical protein
VVAVNLISALEGGDARFGEAEYAAYAKHFGAVVLGVVATGAPAQERQNLLMVAAQSQRQMEQVTGKLVLPKVMVPRAARALTDDFAPVEQLTAVR